jgi:hypothetical protein
LTNGAVLSFSLLPSFAGWMQLVILIYHMTGGSKSLPIYMLIRVLVSAYLFINGYGHFIYAWKEVRDTSAKNSDFQKVIIRFFTVRKNNFLKVTLLKQGEGLLGSVENDPTGVDLDARRIAKNVELASMSRSTYI